MRIRLKLDLWRATEGSAAIVASLAMPLVIGGAAFGIETSYWYYKDMRLQSAADAAAYAAALEKRAGGNADKVSAAASDAAAKNGYAADYGTITVNSPPPSGRFSEANYSGAKKAVEVVVQETHRRYFSG